MRSTLRHIGVSLAGWFSSQSYAQRITPEAADRIDWLRCVPFLAVHLACLGVIWVGVSPVAVAVAAALYFLRMFAITGFYHRYFSHRTFRTSRAFQFVMAVLGNSSAQRGPLWWAAHHRHHHQHSDDEQDVHSPHQHGLLWSHMLWITTASNYGTDMKRVPDLAKWPELRWLDNYDWVVPAALAGLLFLLGAALSVSFPALGTSAMQMVVWGFFISTVVLFHGTCLVNSLAHLSGSRRFETTDHSRNNLLVSLITLGEGWHNNHHHYPSSARQGFYWWEIDITYYLLCGLQKLGLIWNLNPVPARILEQGRGGAR